LGRSNNGIFVKLSNENTYFVREHSFSVRRQCHVTGGVIVLVGDSTFDGSGWLADKKISMAKTNGQRALVSTKSILVVWPRPKTRSRRSSSNRMGPSQTEIE